LTSHDAEHLELEANGHMLRFPAVWLRDNCPCAECLDPVSGQKLTDITELPAVLAVRAAGYTGESVTVTYAPDGHRSVFLRSWLAAHALDDHDGDERTEDEKELWLPAGLDRLPEASWPRYLGEPADRARALAAVLRWGFVLLRDVPPEPGMELEVAASFGFVRETNYGRLFDVRVEPRPGNLAFTSRRILPHTDNPYRDPAPTVQLLHCLRAADDGGQTGLVDGFAAAHGLARFAGGVDFLTGDRRVDSPFLGAFEVLAELPLDLKRVKKEAGALGLDPREVKTKGVDLAPEQVQGDRGDARTERMPLLAVRGCPAIFSVGY